MRIWRRNSRPLSLFFQRLLAVGFHHVCSTTAFTLRVRQQLYDRLMIMHYGDDGGGDGEKISCPVAEKIFAVCLWMFWLLFIASTMDKAPKQVGRPHVAFAWVSSADHESRRALCLPPQFHMVYILCVTKLWCGLP